MSLANTTRSLPVAAVAAELGLDDAPPRALDDLVIDALYAGLFTGRIDAASKCLQIDSVSGRDVLADDPMDGVVSDLAAWCASHAA